MNGEQTLNIFIHFHAQRLTNNTETVVINCIGIPVKPQEGNELSKVSVSFILVPL